MNYLKIIKDALVGGTALPCYAYNAPQGTTASHAVYQLDALDPAETKDGFRLQRVDAQAYIYHSSADTAQTVLASLRTYLAANGNAAYLQAWVTNAQFLFNQDRENLILAIDISFTLKNN
jgi:hypothetical protein